MLIDEVSDPVLCSFVTTYFRSKRELACPADVDHCDRILPGIYH